MIHNLVFSLKLTATAIPFISDVTDAEDGELFGTLSVEVSAILIFKAEIPSSLVAICHHILKQFLSFVLTLSIEYLNHFAVNSLAHFHPTMANKN